MAPTRSRGGKDKATGQHAGGTSSQMFREARNPNTNGSELSNISRDYNRSSEDNKVSNYYHTTAASGATVNYTMQCSIRSDRQSKSHPRKYKRQKRKATTASGQNIMAANHPEQPLHFPQGTLPSPPGESSKSPDLPPVLHRSLPLSPRFPSLPRSDAVSFMDLILDYQLVEAFSREALEGCVSELTPSAKGQFVAVRYSCMLLQEMQGYPLYQPSPPKHPPNNEGVMIGDVGLVTSSGDFDALFNIFKPEGTFPNPPFMPRWFKVQEPLGERDVVSHDIHTDYFSSGGVEQGYSENRSHKRFQCARDDGALLVLPNKAIEVDARNLRFFRKHAAGHAKEWYRYAINERDRDAANGSLYFITGFVKSDNWGIATFQRQTRSNEFLEFITEGTGGSGPTSHRWDRIHGARCTLNASPTPGPVNQCVFLRGYKVSLQDELWTSLRAPISVQTSTGEKPDTQSIQKSGSTGKDVKMSDASSTCTNGPDPRNAPYNGQTSSNTMAERNMAVISPMHPSDIINRMLLRQIPNSTMALTHDSEWCNIVSEIHQDGDFLTHKNFRDVLYRVYEGYDCALDKNGCASLVRRSIYTSEATSSTSGFQASKDGSEWNSQSQRYQSLDSDSDDAPSRLLSPASSLRSSSATAYRDTRNLCPPAQLPTGSGDGSQKSPSLKSKSPICEIKQEEVQTELLQSKHGPYLPYGGGNFQEHPYLSGVYDKSYGSYPNDGTFASGSSTLSMLSVGFSPLGLGPQPYKAWGAEFSSQSTPTTEIKEQPPTKEGVPRTIHHDTVGTRGIVEASIRRRTKHALFECDHCGATFTSSHNRGYHVNSHLGKRPYKCFRNGCSYAASSPATAKRHMKICKVGERM